MLFICSKTNGSHLLVALEQNKSDIALATSWLREKGKSTATKLSSRVAAEGVVALAFQGGNGVIIEVIEETERKRSSNHYKNRIIFF